MPVKRPNDKLLDIDSSLNLPLQFINQLPNPISETHLRSSSNQEIFNIAKVE